MSETYSNNDLILLINPLNQSHLKTAATLEGYVTGYNASHSTLPKLTEINVVEQNTYAPNILTALITESPSFISDLTLEDNYLLQTTFGITQGKLFVYFLRNFQKSLSVAELLKYGWDNEDTDRSLLSSSITRMRAKLSNYHSYPNQIITIRGYGYSMIPTNEKKSR